jgi:hypothetical protein
MYFLPVPGAVEPQKRFLKIKLMVRHHLSLAGHGIESKK